MLKVVLVLSLIALLIGCQQPSLTADLILQNATIYTMNEDQPTAQAVAVVDDTIAFVGSEADVASWIGEDTEVLDMRGKAVTPGFIEGHAHFSGVGANKMNLDLLATDSYDAIIRQVKRAVRDTPSRRVDHRARMAPGQVGFAAHYDGAGLSGARRAKCRIS